MICHTCARGVHTGCRGCPCRHKAEHPILRPIPAPDVTEDESDA